MSKAKKPAAEPRSAGVTEVFAGLRNRLLSTAAADVGLAPTRRLPRVWAVLADLAMGRDFVTIVGIADGTTSMYTSTGGGIIGAGSRPAVAAATARLLDVAEAVFDSLPSADAYPLPARGHVALVALGYDGLRRIERVERDLRPGDGAAGDLYAAVNDVIAQLQIADSAGG